MIFAYHTSTASASIVVTAVILPSRVVTVDAQGVIIRIVSNTRIDIEPVIYSLDKPTNRLTYSPKIQEQYLKLSENINFQKIGTVYEIEAKPYEPIRQSSWIRGNVRRYFSIYNS